ncbi:MAG: MFS transporter [Bacteroidetes bacterium]|nr:MFS transporter [Bacteroidota bacterium]
MKFITRTIFILSLVSLFTDIASEMLYPVMPMYLTSIGFSVVLIGILEGFAEAIAGLSKGYFGYLSDSKGKRKPFIQSGYLLSAVSKPMMAILTFPVWIFFARTIDRFGKGIRTGARDAMLSEETTQEYKGRVFGFHRAFDTLGAALGPLLALVFLVFHPGQYKTLFLLAFIPGLFAVILTLRLKDKNHVSGSTVKSGFFTFLKYWKKSPHKYKLLTAGLLFFALINSSDILLLLMLRYQGANDQQVIAVYIFYNIVYALMSFPMGMLGDKIGLKSAFIFGLTLFAVVYGGIIFIKSIVGLAILFFLYGVYAASTEGISKAWISNIVAAEDTATAVGFYTGMQSICTLIASSLAGWLWYAFSPSVTFGLSASGAVLTILYFSIAFRKH